MTHKIQELMDGTRFRSLWSDHIQDSGAYGRIRELMDEIQDLMEKSYTLSRVPRLKMGLSRDFISKEGELSMHFSYSLVLTDLQIGLMNI